MTDKELKKYIGMGIVGLFLFIGGLLWLMPNYHVWEQQMSGRARLAEAESSRQITIVEAEAKLKSAEALGDAEIVRAEKEAEAINLIADSLNGKDDYLQWLFIKDVAEGNGDKTVVYIPGDEFYPFAKNLETGRIGASSSSSPSPQQ